jgi:17beta-estradiol 17-dehydrogenase / very-long-chain 3-oxoacyl-CoA reductase
LEHQSPNAKIKILVANAIYVSQAQIEVFVAEVKGLHVTILVNNIGGLPLKEDFFKPLMEYTMEEIDDTIYLNSRFMARLTRVLLPILVRNGLSLIKNMSSGAHVGMPYLVMYSATKAFVSGFTAVLGIEAKAEKLPIELIAFAPGSIRSGGHRVALSWSVPSADKWAKEALGRVGCGHLVVPGYWRHALQLFMLRSLPESIRQNASADMMKKMKETQTHYIKKD